ncbi:hypothetical protein CH375_02485 [Leptospira ellisii]|uniref:Uncharacterized protein n=1 Tax=Leptospira ellisii TaxID=2023197 RepID=A0A2N0B9V5_9LEPT|nr:hypothetical protein CH379_08605 [Leptospira ellisii]PKA05908.1 hypothetical protein CH375_02485 [Leptospira ellisii]
MRTLFEPDENRGFFFVFLLEKKADKNRNVTKGKRRARKRNCEEKRNHRNEIKNPPIFGGLSGFRGL